MSLEPDDILADRYRILRRLGRGGMADVFAAEDQTLGRQVAVKMLAAHLLDDPRAHARFQRETRTAATLNHPHIVALHDLVSEGETDFLVMELVAGPSLAHRLRDQGVFVVEEALDVARQVTDGLAAAHDRGLVHRDIKPSNILFDTDGKAKIADFGIARAVETSATMTAAVHGSVPYIAPEQARGDPPDPRSDLYALGCVVFEMLTGQPPFTADTTAAILGQHLHRDPPAAFSLNPDVPADLDAVIARLLAKQPQQRHPDAAALRHDLQHLAAGQP
ncbi:MAG TPA: protein kinase, partial [Egibacteraceae bacterium]|nr:protein kinase [Egibacteraceae bacterium]